MSHPAAPAQALPLPDDNELVIGEGVVLDLPATSFATRMLSGLIDYTVLTILLIGAIFVFVGLLALLDEAAAAAVSLALVVAVIVGVPTTVETLTRGRSLGRIALGLRVVRDDGGPIRLRHAVIRAMSSVLEIWGLTGAPAVICSLANPRGKRIGDLLAGTYVVRERGWAPPPLLVQMPPQLQAWAHQAELGRLPDELAMAVRQFMQRANQMAPVARSELGITLADEVRTRVAPGPPPGTHQEAFLAAVIAERRDRELARLRREYEAAARREALLSRLPYGRG